MIAKYKCWVACWGVALCTQGQTYLSPNDIELTSGGAVYITAATGKALLFFDNTLKKVTRKMELPLKPSGLARAFTNKLYVTGGGETGEVLVIDPVRFIIEKTIPVGHTPMSPVLSPDNKLLYVCNRFDNNVYIINLLSEKIIHQFTTLREPVAADITPDGKYLFVANHLPDGPANVAYVASKITVFDNETKQTKHIPLVNGAEGLRGLKVSPDGKYVFTTHIMARFLVPTTQLERGWISTDALSVIRVEDFSLSQTVLLDDLERGFPNPWAIAFSEDRKMLMITSAGNHELSVIDLPAMMQKIKRETTASIGFAHLNTHNNLSFLSDIRKRVKLSGNGPRAISMRGNKAYIAHYFSDSLEIIDLTTPENIQRSNHLLGAMQKITPVRQGEIYFNDATQCFQNWLSCASCHPDGRTDALNWDLLNDGIGNPKNVKSLLLSHKTPRAMWLGVRPDAPTAVRAGMKHIQFSTRTENEALAVDAYLKSLTPIPSPYLVNGTFTPAAERGKELFEQGNCSECHPPPLFTDLKMHDLGTTRGQDIGRPVDTPSLVEIWRTAPYLHDGRAATMRELLTTFNHANLREKFPEITEDQINDLEIYLLSL